MLNGAKKTPLFWPITAYNICDTERYKKVIDYLISHGANPSSKANGGCTLKRKFSPSNVDVAREPSEANNAVGYTSSDGAKRRRL